MDAKTSFNSRLMRTQPCTTDTHTTIHATVFKISPMGLFCNRYGMTYNILILSDHGVKR